MSNTALQRTGQLLLTNKSGGAVAQGDVVIIDTANAAAFTTTTTSGYVSGTPGVVLEPNGIANNALGMIAIQGYVPVINLSGTGSIGDLIKTHTVAKQGVRNAAPAIPGNFAQALGTSATPVAILWGSVNLSAGAGSDAAAIHVNSGSEISGITEKTSLVAADLFVIEDSAASNAKKRVQAINASAVMKLAESVLVGTAASFDFTSISGSYRHLWIVVQARSDTTAVSQDVHLYFNNDTAGSNYDVEINQANNVTDSASVSVGAAQNFIGQIPAASATANMAGSIDIMVPNYAGSTFYKNYISNSGHARTTAAAGQFNRVAMGQWRNTAAITRVTLLPTANNFIAGSVATLYGLS